MIHEGNDIKGKMKHCSDLYQQLNYMPGIYTLMHYIPCTIAELSFKKNLCKYLGMNAVKQAKATAKIRKIDF